jgi:hypothetical protein
MTMRIIRCGPENGKPPKIVCTGCGKRAAEAGCAIRPEDLETSHSSDCCGHLMLVEYDLSLREPTPQELRELTNHPTVLAERRKSVN